LLSLNGKTAAVHALVNNSKIKKTLLMLAEERGRTQVV